MNWKQAVGVVSESTGTLRTSPRTLKFGKGLSFRKVSTITATIASCSMPKAKFSTDVWDSISAISTAALAEDLTFVSISDSLDALVWNRDTSLTVSHCRTVRLIPTSSVGASVILSPQTFLPSFMYNGTAIGTWSPQIS